MTLCNTTATPTLEFLAVLRDENGPYTKVRVRQRDHEVTIRWGLDAFKYEHIPQQFRAEEKSRDKVVSELQWYLQDASQLHRQGKPLGRCH